MNFFNSFPTVLYRFGDEPTLDAFRDISRYVDIIEDVKDTITLYEDYYIQDGERPDQVSYKLYNNPTFHWTFFLINDHLKEYGWPLSGSKLNSFLDKKFPNTGLTTEDNILTTFSIGSTITGKTSGTRATIIDKNPMLGQIIVKGKKTFTANELIQDQNSNVVALSGGSGKEYEIAHHYIDADNNWTDLNDSDGSIIGSTNLAAVSLYDMYYDRNTDQRSIKVIKPSRIIEISTAFKNIIKS